MVKFINVFTGTEMFVADNRVEEYKAAGHKPVVAPTPKEEDKPVKKKTTTKKRG